MKARLFYDGNCPLCNNYVRMLRKKIDPNKIEYIPSNIKASEFQFVTSSNQVFNGTPAIEQLAKAFPEVLSYFWMLPDKYKVVGLKAAYKVGGIIRKAIKRKKNCNCGK
jgi:hypothetical protein